MALYLYDRGLRRPLYRRIFCGCFKALAVIGWILLLVIVLSVPLGYFEELFIWIWEVTR